MSANPNIFFHRIIIRIELQGCQNDTNSIRSSTNIFSDPKPRNNTVMSIDIWHNVNDLIIVGSSKSNVCKLQHHNFGMANGLKVWETSHTLFWIKSLFNVYFSSPTWNGAYFLWLKPLTFHKSFVNCIPVFPLRIVSKSQATICLAIIWVDLYWSQTISNCFSISSDLGICSCSGKI